MLKRLTTALLISAAAALSAQAATIGPGGSAQGITYDFSLIGGSLASTSATFNIHITGINAATDLEGGRASVNAIAFSTAGLPTILSGSSAFAGLQTGGLNSNGCNGDGGFFCFGNVNGPSAPPLPADFALDISFVLNLVSGDFLSWTPSFKIDWLGSANNYDLVSQTIPGGFNPPPPPPSAVPLPGAVWLFGSGLLGLILLRKKVKKAVQPLAT